MGELIFISNDDRLLNQFTQQLATKFSKKDISTLLYLLSVEIIPSRSGFLLSQHKYIMIYWRRLIYCLPTLSKRPCLPIMCQVFVMVSHY